MRATLLRTAAPLLAGVLLLGGCAGQYDVAAPTPDGASSLAPESPSPPEPDGPGETEDPDDTAKTACDEVVAGIADFNQNDFEGTVDHFTDAVPLAKAELEGADETDSERAGQLLEAVQYYADLAPEDYPEASTSSMEFQRYKAITLGQCVAEGQAPGVPDPSSPGGVEI